MCTPAHRRRSWPTWTTIAGSTSFTFKKNGQGRLNWLALQPDGSGVVVGVPVPTELEGLVGAGDGDGDGKDDVCVRSAVAVQFLPFTGSGFGTTQEVALSPNSLEPVVADLDGDGVVELIVGRHAATARDTQELRILWSSRRGTGTSCPLRAAEASKPRVLAPGVTDGGKSDSAIAELVLKNGSTVPINTRDGLARGHVHKVATGGDVALFLSGDLSLAPPRTPTKRLRRPELFVWFNGAIRAVLRDAEGELITRTSVQSLGVSPDGTWLAAGVREELGNVCGTFVERADGRDRTCVATDDKVVSFAADSSRAIVILTPGRAVQALLPPSGPAVLATIRGPGNHALPDCAAGTGTVVVACLVRPDLETTVGLWVLGTDGVATHAALPPRDAKLGAASLSVDASGVSLSYRGWAPRVYRYAFGSGTCSDQREP